MKTLVNNYILTYCGPSQNNVFNRSKFKLHRCNFHLAEIVVFIAQRNLINKLVQMTQYKEHCVIYVFKCSYVILSFSIKYYLI